ERRAFEASLGRNELFEGEGHLIHSSAGRECFRLPLRCIKSARIGDANFPKRFCVRRGVVLESLQRELFRAAWPESRVERRSRLAGGEAVRGDGVESQIVGASIVYASKTKWSPGSRS